MTFSRTQATVPFAKEKLGKVLLDCIFDCLKLIVSKELEIYKGKKQTNNGEVVKRLKSNDQDLRDCFTPFFKINKTRGRDSHFIAGNTKFELYECRVVKIVLQNYYEVCEETKNSQGFSIPSPLSILYQILTVPEEPQSAAYSLIYCRTLLFESLGVFPEHPLLTESFQSINIQDITSYLDTFDSYTRKSDNIPQTETIPAQVLLAHFLSMKSIFYFRFGNSKDSKNRIDNINAAFQYLDGKSIIGKHQFEFHKTLNFEGLPEASILMNELSGIPIPLRGAEIIFQGGLRTDANSNLVVRVSGEAGSGKTSLALALCAVLSPYNTKSYYLSMEEHPKDLKNRLYSIIPSYLKNLSIFERNVDEWFIADKVPLAPTNRLEYFESEYIDKIEKIFERKINFETQTNGENQHVLPAVCPLVIVIDSIRVLLNEPNSNLEKFIEKCKKLNAIIILISANDEKFHQEIDYLVDLVIHLKHVGTETPKDKPVRILQLTKTRHQISRPGSHILHLSGEKGIRFSPQLPSQIDKKERIVKPTPSNQLYSNFLNEVEQKDEKFNKVKIWDKSQILFHGYGSSGKSGLSMSILLSSLYSSINDTPVEFNFEKYKRKVLVISLLYPEQYYYDLKRKLDAKKRAEAKRIKSAIRSKDEEFITYEQLEAEIYSEIDCLYFYSGFLTPEDFIGRILRKLDQAILEGSPFTGILLDGLHNVSLQFHKLQDSDMVWPTLYSLLAKYRLTIITTFTNFVIENEKHRGSMDDDEILLKGHKPLLHAIVQASDYHFIVQPPPIKLGSSYDGKYLVKLKSAIRHKLGRRQIYVWDRENLKLEVSHSHHLFEEDSTTTI